MSHSQMGPSKSDPLAQSNVPTPTVVSSMRALSIKQPWAALVAHGLKTIEVRRWSTARLGRIYIHAARVPDERPEAWRHVPKELMDSARLAGGIIGSADLVGCNIYHNQEAFGKDRAKHLNEDSWFLAPALYGFVFERPLVLPFYRFPGWLRFFTVDPPPPAT